MFNLDDLKRLDCSVHTKVNLSKIHFNYKVLDLILTYFVNYGLSTHKIALILQQVHEIKISHQTVSNYANSVSTIVKPLVDNFPCQLSNTLCGDETFSKVRGKNQYVFFWSDSEKKIITSYTIYPTRDTKCACQSIHYSLRHYKEIPNDLLLIMNGNPIYNAAQLFFHINGLDFQLRQVIGVKNNDEQSKTYRPYKQSEERLNRTFKQNYHDTNGYMVLFVCFLNFFKLHSSLKHRIPVQLDCFNNHPDMHMKDRWLNLIKLSIQYHKVA